MALHGEACAGARDARPEGPAHPLRRRGGGARGRAAPLEPDEAGFLTEVAEEHATADGIKVEGTEDATFRAIRVEWERGPHTENGAYGIYPVQVTDVLVEDSRVRGSSDAGIYVGQSKNIIVRRNVAWENVAGIEIENSTGADVYENEAYGNSGGLLVFSLPELPVKDGRDSRVWNNHVHDNNHPNFGKEGAIVSTLPPGSGVIVMAAITMSISPRRRAGSRSAKSSWTIASSTPRVWARARARSGSSPMVRSCRSTMLSGG